MLQSEISNNSDFKCNLNCVEIGSRGLVTSDNIKRMRAAFGFVGAKLSSSCIKEVSRMSLLCSYTIWNARNEPQWDTAPYLRKWPTSPVLRAFLFKCLIHWTIIRMLVQGLTLSRRPKFLQLKIRYNCNFTRLPLYNLHTSIAHLTFSQIMRRTSDVISYLYYLNIILA